MSLRQKLTPAHQTAKWYVEAATGEAQHEDVQAVAESLVEDYLDHVSAQLLALPRARRTEIRGEIHQHLQALVQAHEELGADPATAAQAARKQFGDPATIGQAFVQAWRPTVSWEELTAFPRAAMKQGLLWFGVAGTVFAGGAMLASMTGTTLEIAQTWDRVGQTAVFALPLIAGWRTGRTAPVRSALGVFYALSVLAFIFGTAALSSQALQQELPQVVTPCVLMGTMFAWWMPLGCASAAVSGALARRPRFRLAR